MLGCPVDKLAPVGCIGPDFLEPGIELNQHVNQPMGDCAILIVGFRDKGFEHQTFGIDYQMTFAPLDALAGVVATAAPFSVVLTD